MENQQIEWNTAYITIEKGSRDSFGRWTYWVQTMSDQIGRARNETGLSGQIFKADPKESEKYYKDKGYEVVYCDELLTY